MSRFDSIGLFWEDLPTTRKKGGERELGPLPEIPETGWRPPDPSELPDWRNEKVLSFDLETYDPELNDHGPGWARGKGHICGISMATKERSIYVPFRHEVQPELNLDPDLVLRWAKHCLEGKRTPKVGANLIYDVGWCKQEGINVKGQLYDTQFAEALLNETSKVNLEALGMKYSGIGKKVDILKDWCLNYYGGSAIRWRANIYRAPVTLTGHYGEQDAALPLEVMNKQWPLLAQQNLLDLFNLECDLIPLLVEMRFAGVSVDIPYTEKLRDEFVAKEKKMQNELNSLAGIEVNVNAGASIAKAFDKHGLTYPRTSPTANAPQGNPSFQKEFLAGHSHALPALITKLRATSKLRSTFLENYILNANVNGKVFGSFHPMSGTDGGAKTGRFASSYPNLQNIPTRSIEGKLIRNAFVMDAGHDHWRKYDYSQIEYRLLAHFAVGEGADLIRQAYLDDPRTDYHASTAALIEKVTGVKLSRSHTKNINFGLAYGMGIAKLAKDLGVSIAEAKNLSSAYHKGVPFAQETMDALSEHAQETSYNLTILGRRTRFLTWEPINDRGNKPLPYEAAIEAYGYDIKRAYLYRTLNYTLQGSSADMMKAAMVRCYKDGIFDVTGVPRLTVHDELDFSVPERTRIVDEAFEEMRNIMENVIPLRVPVICDLEAGPNWGDVDEKFLFET